ncbi:MAG: hypothetical protein SFY80_12495 [Verrucomicrobiota bacterium]|nr:hypothetical protein [Verrucomicrobiota bacterium]
MRNNYGQRNTKSAFANAEVQKPASAQCTPWVDGVDWGGRGWTGLDWMDTTLLRYCHLPFPLTTHY